MPYGDLPDTFDYGVSNCEKKIQNFNDVIVRTKTIFTPTVRLIAMQNTVPDEYQPKKVFE
jgi:hypothetical protein